MTPQGEVYADPAKTAMIMIGQVTPEQARDPGPALRKVDQPDSCTGISQSRLEPILNGRARRVQSRGAAWNCTFLFATAENQPIMVMAIEKSGSTAKSGDVAVRLLEARLGPVAKAMPQPVAVTQPSAGVARANGPIGLVGLWRSDWVENQYRAFTGLTLVALNNTLIFTPGGYFLNGVPEGVPLDDGGAQQVMRSDPANAGRYAVSGGTIQLNYADGNKETVAAKRVGARWQLIFRNRPMSPKLTFMNGGYLSGTYATERITQAGSAFVIGDDDYSFAPNGRFAKGGQVSLSTAAVSSTQGHSVRAGRYVIKGSALYLSYDDGTQEIYSMFQETAGQEIWLNDQIYSPQGAN